MKPTILLAAMATLGSAPALAQPPGPPTVLPVPVMSGIRLDVVATGEVARTPDLVTISAGVTTRAPQAEAALADNAARLARVRAALARAGIVPRDIQTGSISLSQDYQQVPNGEARPIGYVASNQLTVRFRDIARAGRIIDALVMEGANTINGPAFGLADPDAALDEARTRAVAVARTRAELYARAFGTRVRRVVAISEAGPVGRLQVFDVREARAQSAGTSIEAGELEVGVTVTVTFELDQPTR